MSGLNFLRAFVLCITLSFFGIPSVAKAEEIRFIDVVEVTWRDAVLSTNKAEVLRAIKNDVIPRWDEYSLSRNANSLPLKFTLGKHLESPIEVSRPMPCDGIDASSFMNSIRREAYKRLELIDWADRYLVVLSPEANCIWTGRALLGSINSRGSVIVLHDSSSEFVIAHELGHSLGLGHSNFLRCQSGANDGPWGSDCSAVEYGGTIDIMGNVEVDSPLSTYHQWKLGFISRDEVKQNWISEKVTLTASDVVGGTRVLFLRDGKSTYWIEYRRADARATYKPGLVIYRTDPPPISAVVSPNPEDSLSPEFDEDVTADIWMLNWDNYSYVRSRANGSMTLPVGKTATVFSGNVSIVAAATSDPNKIEVSVTRKADTNPPPAPEVTDSTTWRYPGVSIIKSGYDDGESAIASFEADISGKIVEIPGSQVDNFIPTYLNPFSPAKTVYLRDLPEGNYKLAVRAVDVWGNKSVWSKSVETYVDRGIPIVTGDISLSAVSEKGAEVVWNGVRDEGIGLCATLIHNQEGFVLARSGDKSAPKLNLPLGKTISGKSQVFDCLGNGMTGEISLTSSYVAPANSKRTGRWSPAPVSYGSNALRCTGKCTASISISGPVQALIGAGSASISISGKPAVTVANSSLAQMRFSGTLDVGTRNRVVRISGSNFIFGGLAKLESKFGEFSALSQSPDIVDPSLTEPVQKDMNRFGFRLGDFVQDWAVLPMARGTTLLDPTLDLCSANYPSESGREVRRQISVTKVGSPYQFLSSESVKYKSVAAAEAALNELKKNYDACVKNKGGTENGIFTPYSFQELPKSDAKLVSEDRRVLVRATIGSGASARQLLAFYQYSGSYFTGLYVVVGGEKPMADSEVLRWFNVAEVFAQRLEAGSSGK